MITRRVLYYRKNGTTYGCHLQTTGNSNAIKVKTGGSTLYCPTVYGASTNSINVRVNNATYHSVDLTPVVNLNWSCAINSQPYQMPLYYYWISMSLREGISINRPIYLYMWTNSWHNALTIPAGATSAYISNVRFTCCYSRIDVGGAGVLYEDWSYYWWNKDINLGIPEAWWGV